MFKAFKRKKEILLLKTFYNKSKKLSNGKWSEDSITITYRDLIDNKLKSETVYSPKIKIYISKEECTPNYKLSYIPIEKTDMHEVSYKNLTKEIAEILGDKYLEYFYNNIREGNYNKNKNLHKARRVFSSDLDIEDYVRIQYLLECEGMPENLHVTKGYLDIEVDYSNLPLGNFPDEDIAPSPINAITFINDENNSSYTLLLRNNKNPLIKELEDNLKDFIKEITHEFKEELGVELTYHIAFFDDELELIRTVFDLINTLKPNFILGWNFSFDMLTIINRIKKLGGNPEDIIGHSEFQENAKVFYHKDRNALDEKLRRDWSVITSYSQYQCQLIMYATLRKNFSKLKGGYSLENVSNTECGVGKLNYRKYSNSLANLPYDNYRIFVKYNIRDVIAQKKIEDKVHDVDNFFFSALSNCTRFAKIYNETVFLKNKFTYEYYKKGLIMGNNQNTNYGSFYEDEETVSNDENNEKFDGALVGDPLLNTEEGIIINGHRSSKVFDNVVDFDLESLYPSIIMAHNIDQNCMYFNIHLKDNVMPLNQNPYNYPKYNKDGDFIMNYSTREYLQIGKKWLNLPNYTDLKNLIEECGD